MRRLARFAVGWALASVGAVGCHQLFDGQIESFRCEDEGVFGPPACPDGLTCVAGQCTDVGVPFGHLCDSDEVCPPDSYCLDPADFGADGEPRCSHLCCGSVDCGPPATGMVCHLPEQTTGGYCWPAAELERPAPGAGRPGDECERHSDCRSAVCASGKCDGACCGDSYCGGELVCRTRLSDVADHETFACGAPGGPMSSGLCDSDDDCASGKCVVSEDTIKICAAPCCSSTECVEVVINNISRPVACDGQGGALRSCSRVLTTGATGQLGAPCVDGEDCRSGVCLEAEGGRICSDSCCDDESCGDSSAFACTPMKEGATWALRCVPK